MRDASTLAHRSTVTPDRGGEWAPRAAWSAAVPLEQAMAAKTAPATEAITAYGNHDRWVVECPDCASAQLACRTDHRFMCGECGNVAIGGLWRPVVWPTGGRAIEAELSQRPERVTRNWLPGETVAELAAEREDALRHQEAAKAAVEDPGRWAGHTHSWRNVDDKTVRCDDCALFLPVDALDDTAVWAD